MIAILTLAIVLPGVLLWMRAAEHAAADQAPLGTPPLRLVHAEESELLVRGAVHRHPAGRHR